MEGKRGSECLLKSVSNIDFNPNSAKDSANQDLKQAQSEASSLKEKSQTAANSVSADANQ